MPKVETLVALDIGERRIGVAIADTGVCIAVPFDTVEVTDDGSEIATIVAIIVRESATRLVIGYPRNQSGEPTAQTTYVETVAQKFVDSVDTIVFQDESLTSVLAEQQLKSYNKPYSKGDIDAQAAAIILQDYVEQHCRE